MKDKKLKYAQYLQKWQDCPAANFAETDKIAYRWVKIPITLNDFLPIHVISEPPPRILDDSDKMCSGYGLSLFDTLSNAASRYQKIYHKLRPHQREQFKIDKGTSIAFLRLEKEDGLSDTANDYGHFTFHEYENAELEKKVLETYTIFKQDGTFENYPPQYL
ncbi:hypothetical protein [Hugenholtzia roseola]|uniref:hypothetical protein n=1 Tax=Hugenholtzia roseola TaxID=1002 RepID=UPI00040554A6|nr:hypothetical protein [Hugenholtzia roseola]